MNQVRPIRQRVAEILGGSPEVAEWEVAAMHRDHRATDCACGQLRVPQAHESPTGTPRYACGA